MMSVKKVVTASLAGLATLTLPACGSAEGQTTGPASTPSTSAPANSADSHAANEATATPTQANDEAKDPTSQPATSTSTGTVAREVGSAADAGQARSLALAQAKMELGSEGQVIAQDLEDHKGLWDVDVLVGDTLLEVKVDTASSKALSSERDTVDNEALAAAQAAFSLESAILAAIEYKPGLIEGISWEDGRWDVDLIPDGSNQDHELHIDGTSGRITEDR